MNKVRPIWISSRVPARVTCMQCHAPNASELKEVVGKDAFTYRCVNCGFEVRLTLSELNDPVWREHARVARAC